MIGPGKYDDLCTYVRDEVDAAGVIVIVLGGKRGSGFSAQLPGDVVMGMPAVLRQVADEIERTNHFSRPQPATVAPAERANSAAGGRSHAEHQLVNVARIIGFIMTLDFEAIDALIRQTESSADPFRYCDHIDLLRGVRAALGNPAPTAH